VRKAYQEKLRPTPAHERLLDDVLWRCRTLYNTALEQRITAWERCHVSVTRYQQEAELQDLRAAFADYAAIHSHVLQDVLARLDKTYQAFFRRVAHGEKPGFPRFHGRNRYHSFTFKEYGNGARLDNGHLILSKIGRIAVRWSRPLEGTPKTVTISREADGWYVSFSCADVPTEPLPGTGRETGIDVGLRVFLATADGKMVENPPPLPPGRNAAGQSPAPRLAAEEGQRASQEGSRAAGQSPPTRQAPTPRLPPQDGARVGVPVRHDLSRGHPIRQSEPAP
jgi:putative transposase